MESSRIHVKGKTHHGLATIPIVGIIIPIMGMTDSAARRSTGIADALFSKVQQRVLALLFGQPNRGYQSAELIRLVASGTGAVQRCVTALVSSGLVNVTAIGNQRHYRANTGSPAFEALHQLVLRTVGLAEPVRSALLPFRDRIHESFVFGSVAKGKERASSDVDLLVVSDSLNYSTLYESLAPVEATLARRVNPVLLTLEQWRNRLAHDESFAARIKRGEIIVIQEAPDGTGGARESLESGPSSRGGL